jgi:hypothetical protein
VGLTPFLFPTTRIGLYIMVRVDAAMRGWQAKLCACVASGRLRPAGGAACPQSGPRPCGANLPWWCRPPRLRALTGAAWRRSRRPAAAYDAAGAAEDASSRAQPMDARPDMVCLMK